MDILIAQRELIHRLYWWSLEEADKEAILGYPLLKDVTNPGVAAFLSVVSALDTSQCSALSRALVKNAYFQAPKQVDMNELLEDVFLPDEHQLAQECLNMLMAVSIGVKAKQHKDCVPSIPRRIVKNVTHHLSTVLHSTFIRNEPSSWRTSISVCDWEIIIELYFSGIGIECSYWLLRDDSPNLLSADIYQQYLGQSMNFDYVRRLGVSSTRWVVECEQDIPSSLSSISLICTKVLAQLPILLQGLGIED